MKSLMKSVHKLKAVKQLRKSKGFTLIELMIVVAIIGILAAIAIPNFLTYQLKSRQAEAKVNVQAIRTSEIAFQAEKGCYLGVTAYGGGVATTLIKNAPVAWGVGPAASATTTVWCTANGTAGTFTDIGFKAAGSVNYSYAVNMSAVATPIVACNLGNIAATGAVTTQLANTGFTATAGSNLDGDASINVWAGTNDNGADNCGTGLY